MAEAAHADSEKILNPGLDVLRVLTTEISIDAYRMVTIHPTTTGIKIMEFIIPALDDPVDLNRSYFTIDLRFKKDNAGNLVADEKLWVTNNLAHTIIKQNGPEIEWHLDQPPIGHVPLETLFGDLDELQLGRWKNSVETSRLVQYLGFPTRMDLRHTKACFVA